jgi:cytochrome c biogenesis protein CcmG/thiol:disulfide interchange protein DsbE
LKKIAVFVFFVFLIAGAACRKSATETDKQPSLQGGGAAPNFVLRDVEGKEVALSEFRGKVVLLEFWATWCPPCRATVPELTEIQQKYGNKGLIVLGVSLDEGGDLPAKLASFSREFKINYRLLIGNEEMERAYNVTSIPMTVLIDRGGNIITSYLGYVENLTAVISKQVDKAI